MKRNLHASNKTPAHCRLCENWASQIRRAASTTMRPFFMSYIRGEDRGQAALLPAAIEDYVAADAPVRVIDAFVDGLDVSGLGFGRSVPAATGRPPYDPRDLLKLYIWGYFNEVRSSRSLERECRRNVEAMWLLRRLSPDFKTIADFRRDNGSRSSGHAGPSCCCAGSGTIHGPAGGSRRLEVPGGGERQEDHGAQGGRRRGRPARSKDRGYLARLDKLTMRSRMTGDAGLRLWWLSGPPRRTRPACRQTRG